MSNDVTVQREDYTPLLKAVNAVVGLGARLGMSHNTIEVHSILDEARRNTGLSDFGSDEFLEAMEVYCQDIRSAEHSAFGLTLIRSAAVKAVTHRLQFQAWVKANPAVLDVKIEKPVFVLGFPRTGTTTLQNLLALDPSRRGLQFWEVLCPVPGAGSPARETAARQRFTKLILGASYVVAPEMRSIHEVGWNTLEECWPLMGASFAAMNFDLQAGRLTSYGDFLMGRDMRQAYRDYKGFLQGLLYQRPARQLVLKCPEHLWFLDAILDVFPDARIVWTHRDPYDSIASYCSLISIQNRNIRGVIDNLGLGRSVTERFHGGVTRAMEMRRKIPADQFIDVNFEELVADTPGTVRRVTQHFGLEEDARTPARVDEWLRSSRGDARGSHHYNAARYGLDEAEIDRRYAEYIQAFQIPTDRRKR